MACDKRAKCGDMHGSTIPNPFADITSITIIVIIFLLGLLDIIFVYKKTINTDNIVDLFEKIGLLGSTSGGLIILAILAALITAFIVALILLAYIYYFAKDRCDEKIGERVCISGVVYDIIPSFNKPKDWLFPFMAMHDRVDIIIKSNHWSKAEAGGAFVFCTGEPSMENPFPPTVEFTKKSEILRTYFFTKKVCKAANASLIGGFIGALIGIAAAAIVVGIGVAIFIAVGGCTLLGFETVGIGCIIAIIVAAIIVAAVIVVACILVCAAIAGIIVASRTSENTDPSDSTGHEIVVSDLITLHGNMLQRENDNSANVFWWIISSSDFPVSLSGRLSGDPNLFSYCDIDDIFIDACAT